MNVSIPPSLAQAIAAAMGQNGGAGPAGPARDAAPAGGTGPTGGAAPTGGGAGTGAAGGQYGSSYSGPQQPPPMSLGGGQQQPGSVQLPPAMQADLNRQQAQYVNQENWALAQKLDQSQTFGNNNGKLDFEELSKFMIDTFQKLGQNPNDQEAQQRMEVGQQLMQAVLSGQQFGGWPQSNQGGSQGGGQA